MMATGPFSISVASRIRMLVRLVSRLLAMVIKNPSASGAINQLVFPISLVRKRGTCHQEFWG